MQKIKFTLLRWELAHIRSSGIFIFYRATARDRVSFAHEVGMAYAYKTAEQLQPARLAWLVAFYHQHCLLITNRGKTYAPAKKSCRKINFCYLSIHNLDSIRNVCPVFCTFYSSFSHITLNSISIFFQSLTLNHLAF